jgi:hypothetical protein
LAELAWNYFCNRFAKSRDNRLEIISRLKKLLNGSYGLDTKANRTLISDMEMTLAPVKPASDRFEPVVNALLELDVEGNWPGCGYEDARNYADWDPSYRTLRDAGLQAVPALLQHLEDYRLTRCIEQTSDGQYTWHVRIADVVAQLLNGLAPEPFAHEFQRADGRGVALDSARVQEWWKEASAKRELDYLLKNAFKNHGAGGRKWKSSVLHALGNRYPEHLVRLFEEDLKNGRVDYDLFVSLADSKAGETTKDQLFEKAVASKDEWTRAEALSRIVHRRGATAVPTLLKSLREIPKTPSVAYWMTQTGKVTQIASCTKDERVWQVLEETAKRVDIGQRMEILDHVHLSREAKDNLRAIRLLKSFLNDTEVRDLRSSALFDGPSAAFLFERIAVRNFAAQRLANALGLELDPDPAWKEADWQKLRERVSAALAKREHSIPVEELRKK